MHILVTGGGGFLGKAIIRRLIKRGDRVTSMARNHYPELESWGVRCVQADIGDQSAVAQAAAGVDAIIHTAAKAGIWGRYDEYYRANVVGTANVIRAAEEHKIKKNSLYELA